MTLFRGSGSPGQGTDVEFLRSDRNLSDVGDADTARQNLGLATLSDIASLTPTDSLFIVGDGTNWVGESGATARTSMGVGTVATLDQGTATGQVPTNSDIDGRGFAESVASVAALRAGSFPSSLDRIWLSGYYGVGTAGGGQLYRDSGDTSTADNGATVFVDTSGVRWKRSIVPSVLPGEYAGIRADGTNDDRQAIANADAIGDFTLPRGTVKVSSNLTTVSRIYFEDGAVLAPDSTVTVTLNGLIHAGQHTYPFGGDGVVSRPIITAAVPGDFATIQEAVDNCPRFLYQYYTVEIADGTYAEHVVIRDKHAADVITDTLDSREGCRMRVRSANSDKTLVTVSSFYVQGCTGGTSHPVISDLTLDGTVPYTDEEFSAEFYGSHTPGIYRINFRAGTTGSPARGCIVSYASSVDYLDIDFGNNTYQHGLRVKHTGTITEVSTQVQQSTGEVQRWFADADSGRIELLDSLSSVKAGDIPVGNRSTVSDSRSGIVTDMDNGQFWGAAFLMGGAWPPTEWRDTASSLDGIRQITSGSGSISLDATNGRYDLNTGTTSGSEAQAIKMQTMGLHDVNPIFAYYNEFAAAVEIVHSSNNIWYIGYGNLGSDFIGFKGDGSSLWGVAITGGTETTVELEATGVGGTVKRSLRCWNYSGAIRRVVFIVNGDYLGALDSGIPAAGNVVDRKMDAKITNSSSATKQFWIYDVLYRATREAP